MVGLALQRHGSGCLGTPRKGEGQAVGVKGETRTPRGLPWTARSASGRQGAGGSPLPPSYLLPPPEAHGPRAAGLCHSLGSRFLNAREEPHVLWLPCCGPAWALGSRDSCPAGPVSQHRCSTRPSARCKVRLAAWSCWYAAGVHQGVLTKPLPRWSQTAFPDQLQRLDGKGSSRDWDWI